MKSDRRIFLYVINVPSRVNPTIQHHSNARRNVRRNSGLYGLRDGVTSEPPENMDAATGRTNPANLKRTSDYATSQELEADLQSLRTPNPSSLDRTLTI